MTCESCGSKTMMQVQVVVSAPSELMHQFSKENLRRKDVQLMGVLWETANHICSNLKCGKVVSGYGNYVTRLEKELSALKAKPTAPNPPPRHRRGLLPRGGLTTCDMDEDESL